MHGRRLATIDQVACLATEHGDEALEQLESWTTTHGIDLTVRSVGEEFADTDFAEDKETLGVAIGGDGTFLEGIRAFAPRQVPLLGINTGTLAFLARVEPRDIDAALTEILRGRATVYDRQQFSVTGAGLDAVGVNDVVVEPMAPEEPIDRKICRLHVFVDDEYVGQYDGSGVAISTPTGSTGLALSAGGPIHYPNNDFTLQITPLHTHKLGVRPLVVSETTDITVVPESQVQLSVDGGRHHRKVDPDEPIRITGADYRAHVVRTSYDDSFMAALAGKLGWGLRGKETDVSTRHLPAGNGAEDFLSNACRVAREAAISAGEPVQELHGQVEQVEFKTDKADIVTEADYQSNRIIATAIENEFPNHTIRSEESETKHGDDPYTWVIDPLDGTGNFAHGNPNYAIVIALLDGDDVPVVGVVYAPETEEMFYAIAGRGAYRNDTPIQPTTRDTLDESMLLSGYDPNGDFLQAFYHETRGVRRLGSAGLHLCFVAAGSADALWEYDTYPWDVAGGLCILREAGGRATDADGNVFTISLDDQDTRASLLASNGPLHDALLAHLPD
ncbi:MAG: inositol monophosphatase family protein [Halovenus sp.]